MISKVNEDATFASIRYRDNDCACKSAIGAAACYGATGATTNELLKFIWNVAVRYANDDSAEIKHTAEIRQHLRDANRGAEINAKVMQRQAKKITEMRALLFGLREVLQDEQRRFVLPRQALATAVGIIDAALNPADTAEPVMEEQNAE